MYCLRCQYRLDPTGTSRCAECGAPFDAADPRTFLPALILVRKPRPLRSVIAGFASSAVLLVVFALLATLLPATAQAYAGISALIAVALCVVLFASAKHGLVDSYAFAAGSALGPPSVFLLYGCIVAGSPLRPPTWVLLSPLALLLCFLPLALAASLVMKRARSRDYRRNGASGSD